MKKIKHFLFLFSFIAGIFCAINDISFSQTEKYLFSYNVFSGSISKEQRAVMIDSVVQRVLLDIAIKPRTEDYISTFLKGKDVTAKKLSGFDIIREEEGLYYINFYLHPNSSLTKIRELTEAHAKIIADEVLNRRQELESLANTYKLEEVDPKAVLYVILGCFSLDWDGLRIIAEKEIMSTTSFWRKIFPKTIIYGWEGIDISRKGFYKGSHNSYYGNIRLTSFGDHEIQPRRVFPDLLWANLKAEDPLKQKFDELQKTYSKKEIGEKVGLIMFCLREGKKTDTEIIKATGIGGNNLKIFVDILSTVGYVTSKENYYYAKALVLTKVDKELVKKIRKIGWEVLEKWCSVYYPKLQEEMLKIIPFCYGLNTEDIFYNTWHDIFGAANRMLVESGLYADPYSERYGGKGVVPFIFDNELE